MDEAITKWLDQIAENKLNPEDVERSLRYAKDLEQGLAKIRTYSQGVSIFGSARTQPGDKYYEMSVEIAEKHGLKEQVACFDPTVALRVGSTDDVHMALEDMLPPEQYDPAEFVRRTVENMSDGETYVLVFHPGYLDAFILGNSSLTANRTKEVDALIDPALRAWLEAQPDLRLIDYRDL